MTVINMKKVGLPIGWVICRLPDFSNVVMGQSPSSDTYNQAGDGLPFFQGKAEFGEIYPKVRKYCSEPNKIAEPGATLLSVRAPVGPTNLVKERSCIGRGLAAIHPLDDMDPVFILFLLRSIEPDISDKGTGSTFKAVSKAFVEELEFALPPLGEQNRIVAKLEELFSELDKGVESLKTAREQLKVYRQAVLKHAFEGKLTARWREENKAGRWKATSFGNLLLHLTSGSRGWAKYYSSYGDKFIRAQNIKHDRLDVDDLAYVDLPEKSEGMRTRIQAGDLLITITGANVTKTALVKSDIGVAYVSQHVALCRTDDNASAAFLYWYLISEAAGRMQLKEFAYGAGKPGLNLENIRSVLLELPSLEEQLEIVAQIDTFLSVEENCSSVIEAELSKVESLRQSILKQAFSGQLVPQDPNDEPASVLLERIRAERAAQAKPQPRKKATRKGRA